MSEYLRLIKKHMDQLEGSVYSIKKNQIVIPSITVDDRRKIYFSAYKDNPLYMKKKEFEIAKRKKWIKKKDGKNYWLPGIGPVEVKIIN